MAPWQLCPRAYVVLLARGLRWEQSAGNDSRLPRSAQEQHDKPSPFTYAYCNFFQKEPISSSPLPTHLARQANRPCRAKPSFQH